MISRFLSHSMKVAAAMCAVALSSCGGSGENGDQSDASAVPDNFVDSLSMSYGTQLGAQLNIDIAAFVSESGDTIDRREFLEGLRKALSTDVTAPGVMEGMSAGINLAAQLDSYNAVGLHLRRSVVADAFGNALSVDSLTEREADDMQYEFDQRMTKVQYLIHERLRQIRRQELFMRNKQRNENLEAVSEFVNKLKQSDTAVVESSTGLLYKFQRQGEGAKVRENDSVRIVYSISSALDDRIIDSSRGNAIGVVVNDDLIAGLVEGLKLMSKGSKATFYIPTMLGFGRDNESVKPGEMIIVDVELIEISR